MYTYLKLLLIQFEDNFFDKQRKPHLVFGISKIVYDFNSISSLDLSMYWIIRNYNLAYLLDVNGLITYSSTGLRGMKYKNHPILGSLLPLSVKNSAGKNINITKRSPSFAGGGVSVYLTDIGNELLVDLANHRKS